MPWLVNVPSDTYRLLVAGYDLVKKNNEQNGHNITHQKWKCYAAFNKSHLLGESSYCLLKYTNI